MNYGLPVGWSVGRNTRGIVPVFYEGIKVGKYEDDLYKKDSQLRDTINYLDQNPPVKLYPLYFKQGRLHLEDVHDATGMRLLIQNKLVSMEEGLKQVPRVKQWLKNSGRLLIKPDTRPIWERNEYPTITDTGVQYIKFPDGWKALIEGELIPVPKKQRYRSVVDARVAFATGNATLYNIAEYSWGAVLEVVGDIVYQSVKQFNQTILPGISKIEAFMSHQTELVEEHKRRPYTREKLLARIAEAEEKTTRYKSVWLLEFLACLKMVVMKELNAIIAGPRHLVGFTPVQIYRNGEIEAIYQRQMNISDMAVNPAQEKRFWDAIDKLFAWKTSGYGARLRWQKRCDKVARNGQSIESIQSRRILREERRFQEQLTPYIPFLAERRFKYDKYSNLKTACKYVRQDIWIMEILKVLQPKDGRIYFTYQHGEYGIVLASGKVFFSYDDRIIAGYVRLEPEILDMSIEELYQLGYTDDMFPEPLSKLYKGVRKTRGYLIYLTHDREYATRIACRKHLRITKEFSSRRRKQASSACVAANKDATPIIYIGGYTEWVSQSVNEVLNGFISTVRQYWDEYKTWISPLWTRYWEPWKPW